MPGGGSDRGELASGFKNEIILYLRQFLLDILCSLSAQQDQVKIATILQILKSLNFKYNFIEMCSLLLLDNKPSLFQIMDCRLTRNYP